MRTPVPARALLAGALLLGCSSGTGATRNDNAMMEGSAQALDTAQASQVDNPEAARLAVGKRVRIEGTARNAKLSAVVVRGDLVVYCLDRESWPSDVDGKQVEVKGALEYTSEFQAKESPSGEISQGTSGGIFALRRSEYALSRP